MRSGIRRTTGVALLALAAATAAAAAGEKGKDDSQPLGAFDTLRGLGAREPSGIACDPRGGRLFVVGDEGTLVEMDGAGRARHVRRFAENLEDVAVDPASGDVVLLSERSSELIFWDAAAGRETRRVGLDAAALLGQAPRERQFGFEGVAFGGDGGILYLVHQRGPAMLLAARPPAPGAATLSADAVAARIPLDAYGEVTAVTWVPALSRLLVLADARDLLLVLTPEGEVEAEVKVPGAQQEGVCIDGAGALWLADDRAGAVLRLPSGLTRLRAGPLASRR